MTKGGGHVGPACQAEERQRLITQRRQCLSTRQPLRPTGARQGLARTWERQPVQLAVAREPASMQRAPCEPAMRFARLLDAMADSA